VSVKDLQFRQMTAEDIKAVLEIERECALSPWSFEGYKDELSRNDSKLIIAENKSGNVYEIVGFAAVRLITSAKEGEILNIAVRPDFRKQGVGTFLLKEIEGSLKRNRIERIWLEVRKSNPAAQHFYLRNGFEFSGERKNFYTNPPEDALLMKLYL